MLSFDRVEVFVGCFSSIDTQFENLIFFLLCPSSLIELIYSYLEHLHTGKKINSSVHHHYRISTWSYRIFPNGIIQIRPLCEISVFILDWVLQ